MHRFVLFLIVAFFALAAPAADLNVEFSLLGDTAHFEFTGRDQWDYDLELKTEKGKSFYQMRVPRLSDQALSRLKSVQGGPIKSIEIKRGGADGSDQLRVNLVANEVESFDYLTDQPSRLIVDLYPQKKAIQAKNAKPEENGKASKNPSAKGKRNIATTDFLVINNGNLGQEDSKGAVQEPIQSGIFDGSDPDFKRFTIQDYEIREDAIIQSREKDYIDFPMLHQEPDELQVLNGKKPVYEIKVDESGDAKLVEENKMARLLLTLYANKRPNVFLKTVEWFYEKFPNSKYDEIVRFMWADTHYALYEEDRAKNIKHFDLAMFRYREVLHKYPDSALAERTLLLMGYGSLDRGDYLGTLRMFNQHIAKRHDSANRDMAQLAIAEAFLKLNQYDEAIKIYEQVEKNARRPEDKIKATFLKGDVYFKQKDDAKSTAVYQAAAKKYPNDLKDYPNATYNQAAALFRQGDYRASLALYKDFLKRFPSHSYAGYAMTRIGELMDIMGVDPARVTGAYLETYFRYGDTPSSLVARLRLFAARMKNMKEKEREKSLNDIMELAKASTLPKIEQFATLLTADGLTSRGQYDEAIDLLVKYYQDHVTTADTQRLNSKIVRNINEKIREQVVTGKFIDALKTHDKHANSWLKSSDRIDTRYWVGRAFDQAGVLKESEKLYRDTLNKVYSLQGTRAGIERNIFEKLPSTDELHLRLGSVQYRQENWNLAYDHLKAIQKPELLSEVDQVERVQMGAALLDKKGESEVALRYLAELIKSWKGIPALVSDLYFDAGEIEAKMGRKDDAMASFNRVDELMRDSGLVSPVTHVKALEKIAQLHLDQKKPDLALPVIEGLLKTYEKSRPLSSWRYRLGQIYFDKGQIQKATAVWDELKSEKSEFWYKLAQDQIKGAVWSDEYKKYIRRIPAMSNEKEKP